MPKPVIRLKPAPPLWTIHSERQWIARKMGSLTLTIKPEQKAYHEKNGFKVYSEHPVVTFRPLYPCDLPYAEFMLGDRLHIRENGMWKIENRATGMPPRGPGYKPVFWNMGRGTTCPLLDIRVLVLARQPIPVPVVEHPSIGWHNATAGAHNSWPNTLLLGSDRHFECDDGEYVKDLARNEYVFKPHVQIKFAKKAVAKLPVAPVSRRMRGDEDDDDLFTPKPKPSRLLRE